MEKINQIYKIVLRKNHKWPKTPFSTAKIKTILTLPRSPKNGNCKPSFEVPFRRDKYYTWEAPKAYWCRQILFLFYLMLFIRFVFSSPFS